MIFLTQKLFSSAKFSDQTTVGKKRTALQNWKAAVKPIIAKNISSEFSSNIEATYYQKPLPNELLARRFI